MDEKQISYRLSFVITPKMADKVSVEWDEFGRLVVTIDLHELRKMEADRMINNVISIIRIPFTLALIHGYNHGTVLKEHIHNEMNNPRIINRYCESWNPGETFLEIA